MTLVLLRICSTLGLDLKFRVWQKNNEFFLKSNSIPSEIGLRVRSEWERSEGLKKTRKTELIRFFWRFVKKSIKISFFKIYLLICIVIIIGKWSTSLIWTHRKSTRGCSMRCRMYLSHYFREPLIKLDVFASREIKRSMMPLTFLNYLQRRLTNNS